MSIFVLFGGVNSQFARKVAFFVKNSCDHANASFSPFDKNAEHRSGKSRHRRPLQPAPLQPRVAASNRALTALHKCPVPLAINHRQKTARTLRTISPCDNFGTMRELREFSLRSSTPSPEQKIHRHAFRQTGCRRHAPHTSPAGLCCLLGGPTRGEAGQKAFTPMPTYVYLDSITRWSSPILCVRGQGLRRGIHVADRRCLVLARSGRADVYEAIPIHNGAVSDEYRLIRLGPLSWFLLDKWVFA